MTVHLYRRIIPSSYGIINSFSWKCYSCYLPHLTENTNARMSYSTADSLIPLPVPPLNQTVEKFLNFAKTIQSIDEYEQTEELAKNFIHSKEAANLQNLLEQRARRQQNWLTPWWLYAAYLNVRTPVTIFSSPGVTFPYSGHAGLDAQIHYAAKIIQAALKFHHLILRDKLEEDKGSHGVVFDMSQYKLLFGTTRIPRRVKDEIRYGKDQANLSRHILVTRNGHTFKLFVYTEDGQMLGLHQLHLQLQEIVAAVEQQNIEAVNIISSDDRDSWANVYERLKMNNPIEVEDTENALFVMALDKEFAEGDHPEDRNMQMALHGGGPNKNAKNRWFDKTLQFYVNESGYAGMTYEHTPAEGPPLARLLDFICDQINDNSFEPSSKGSFLKPQELQFKLDVLDREAIKKAEYNLESLVRNLEVKSLIFDDFGKNVPKRAQLSPDSCIQVALQLSYFRIHNSHPPAYETGTLRKFIEGRTDTIRLPTMESVRFIEAFSKLSHQQMTDSILFSLLENAIASHKKYSMEVMNGRGIDRHLLGLKLIAEENGLPIPKLMNSKAYRKLMHFQLSTSQVPTKHILPMGSGFGPSAPDCYGICYNPQETRIFFTITAFNECRETSAERFSKELRKAFLDIHDLCEKAGRLKERAKL